MTLTAQQELRRNELRRLKNKAESLDLSMAEAARIEEQEQAERETKLDEFKETGKRLLSDAVAPLGDVGPAFRRIVGEAREDLASPNVLNKGLGALRLAGASGEATAESLVGTPIANALREVVPESIAKFAGETAQLGAEVFTPAGLAKNIINTFAREAPEVAGEFAKIVRNVELTPEEIPQAVLKEKAGIKDVPEQVDELAEGEAFTRRVSVEVTGDIARAAEDALAGSLDESRRLFRQITEKLEVGEIDVESLPDILQKHDLSPEDFAKEFSKTVSESAKTLQQLSAASKRLRKLFEGDKQAKAILDDMVAQGDDALTAGDKFALGWRNLENFRRGMLVTQLATATRNAMSQAGRVTVSSMDEALQSVFKGGDISETLSESRKGFSALFALRSRLSKDGRQRFDEIIDSQQAALAKAQLFSQPVHEVVLANKTLKIAGALNRTQEYFFRKLAFESKLRDRLKDRGLEFDTVDPEKIPQKDLEAAVEHAMEMSFAANAKGKAAQEFIKAWSKSPLTLINPFPRFAFANALPFVIEHSPLGFASALGPETMRALAKGDSSTFARKASRAFLGTMFLEAGLNIRNGEMGGERWYEVRTGNQTIDTRAFAPFSTYLFLAETISHPERLEAKDYAEAAIGLNRIAGTGLVFTDALRAKDLDSLKDTLSKFTGEFISGFTVAARTAKDFVAQIDPEESIARDTRQSPLIGPTLNNFPGLSQFLPENYSPLQVEEMRTEDPALRQVTGLTKRFKTDIAKEVDRLGINASTIFPRTGIAEANNKLERIMAPLVREGFDNLKANTNYKELSPEVQVVALGRMFSSVKEIARSRFDKQFPELAKRIQLKQKFSGAERDAIESQTGADLEAVINP